MRVISKKDARLLTSLSIQHMARLASQGKFPRLVKLGDDRNSRAGYVETEVQDWLAEKLRLRDETPSISGDEDADPSDPEKLN